MKFKHITLDDPRWSEIKKSITAGDSAEDGLERKKHYLDAGRDLWEIKSELDKKRPEDFQDLIEQSGLDLDLTSDLMANWKEFMDLIDPLWNEEHPLH
jgi:hypothetical protein